MIFSDEIHSDFVFDKNFIPLGRIAEEEDQVISACSPIKSFNMAGL